jgi:signal transduction histidine kinase
MGEDEPARPNLLIVDDTIENLNLLANLFIEQGYDVRPVTTGAQALRAVEGDPPDLILLDVNMPTMDGYEVCERLKSMPQAAEVPVIFLTAANTIADKVKAFKTGGVDYVTKPFQVEEIIARVKAHVALRRAKQEIEAQVVRLNDLEKLRDDLVHMVVHDMRSPLGAIIGLLGMVRDDARPVLSEESMNDLVSAMQSAWGLNRMANDLLDVRKLEERKLPLERTPCDLAALARDVCTRLASAERRPIEVSNEVPGKVSGDERLLSRVIENLVSNAIKHTPEKGAIHIRATAAPGHVRLAVIDEGKGVPADAKEKIFEKFGRVATSTTKYHSAGLGLAFCKLAIETHGGRIGVDDGATGGSVFWFELPA